MVSLLRLSHSEHLAVCTLMIRKVVESEVQPRRALPGVWGIGRERVGAGVCGGTSVVGPGV